MARVKQAPDVSQPWLSKDQQSERASSPAQRALALHVSYAVAAVHLRTQSVGPLAASQELCPL